MPVKKLKTKKTGKKEIILTPQQEEFLSYYIDPDSPTFSDAKNSAIRAKYTKKYAESITAKDLKWLSVFVGQDKKLEKAEKNLDDMLDLDVEDPIVSLIGVLKDEKGKVLKKVNTNKLRVKADITKFIAERLGKKKYSIRTEHTGKDGEDISVKVIEIIQPK